MYFIYAYIKRGREERRGEQLRVALAPASHRAVRRSAVLRFAVASYLIYRLTFFSGDFLLRFDRIAHTFNHRAIHRDQTGRRAFGPMAYFPRPGSRAYDTVELSSNCLIDYLPKQPTSNDWRGATTRSICRFVLIYFLSD